MTDSVKYEYPATKIDFYADDLAAQFDGVVSHYKDFSGDALERNYADAANKGVYTDNSNRNDITDIRVAHDGEKLYFCIQTKEDVTPYNGTDENWMNLFIGDGKTENTFAGYRYRVNRSYRDGKASVERYRDGEWISVGEAELRVSGNTLAIALPLSLIGKSSSDLSIEFKVADNVTHSDDIMDYYVTGDSAPIGRLSYSYGY